MTMHIHLLRCFASVASLLAISACNRNAPESAPANQQMAYKMKTAAPNKPATTAQISATIHLVDIIPATNSGETNQDSEPSLSVNPLNTNQIVASAFTPGPFDTENNYCPRNLSPIYVSTDAGESWALNCIIPTYPSTFDITVRFGPQSGNLYAAILLNNSSNMVVLRTPNILGASPMQPLLQRTSYDQPYIEAARGAKSEAIYVGENNCCQVPVTGGKSANIDQSFDAGTSKPNFNRAVIESRDASGFDLASVRTSIHQADNTVYGVFMGVPELADDQSTLGSVVVVRDDHGGNGTRPYTSLKDKDDKLSGAIVANKLPMPPGPLGQQRLLSQSHVSIAVDPRGVSNYPIYVAWVDRSGSGTCTLHIRRSNDKGQNWSQDLRTVQDATNPALAVNSDGIVAILYQQLVGGQTWETHFEMSADEFVTVQELPALSKAPDASPVLQFEPYLGDYAHLQSIGRTFYGTFSANNTPDRNNFPFLKDYPDGLIYQREANFDTHVLSDSRNHVSTVAPSIDPFFVEVTLSSPPESSNP
jgi:hypothetical protein